jgi:hypothetical protein
VSGWQSASAGRLAVEGALEQARARLSSGDLALLPEEQATWRVGTLGPRGVGVRVRRQEDVAVRLDGRIVPAAQADFGERVTDREGRAISPYLRLEVYLVEAEAEGTASSPSIRLLGGLARLPDGRTLSLGHRCDRRGG